MTKVRFFSEKGLLTGFEISGHSGYADEGSDIICAGISSAAYMTANTVTEIYRVDADAKVSDGYMCFTCKKTDKRADELFRGLKLHLLEFCGQYPDYITIEND
ncbi:MAG: ribosomal-processing cysteine protease Prp [Clostridia bacterium]|nr:ribosomal-processing cysteine protease Prp [Clostridia bacterium]